MTAKVLVIGAGGLGSPALEYLAAAGIGTIGIADHDKVELSEPSTTDSLSGGRDRFIPMTVRCLQSAQRIE